MNALKSDLGLVCCFGYKFQGDKKARCLTLDEDSVHKFSDRKLLIEASEIMAQADLLVAHYGSVFDRRFIQGRLLINNLPPIPNTKMRDTCMVARSVANFSSNRLKHLAKILGLDNQKLENNWPDAWFQVMRGNMKVLREMAAYCRGDVEALESLYNRLLSFDTAHPRMVQDRSKCGVCGGEVEYRGYAYTKDSRYRRFVCRDCRRWGRESSRVREGVGGASAVRAARA